MNATDQLIDFLKRHNVTEVNGVPWSPPVDDADDADEADDRG